MSQDGENNGDVYLELRRMWGWTGGRLFAVATPARSELGGEERGEKFILENGLRGRNIDLSTLSGCSVLHTPRSFVFFPASAKHYVFFYVFLCNSPLHSYPALKTSTADPGENVKNDYWH